ncbi:MAG: zinc-dependent alcohol dehydrogenase [Christensenellaceae bacterium]
MKALIVNGNGTLTLETDLKKPEVSDYTAIVKTFACGICNGTDTKLLEGHLYGFPEYPAVLGHEAVGEVIEVGAKVRSYQLGDHVLRPGLDDSAHYYSRWGGFAEYTRVIDYNALLADGLPANEGDMTQQVIPKEIDPVKGTMIITLKEVYSALRRLNMQAGDSVAVAGCGPVGLAMVAYAKILGASFIALSGHHDHRIAVAKKLDADLAVNAKQVNFVEALQQEYAAPLDLYIDAVGRTGNISQALSLIKEDGTIGVYGIGIEENKGIDWYCGPYNFKLHSVQWPIPREEAKAHDAVIASVLNGSIDLSDFVTHTLPIDAYQKGFDLIASREGLKVVLTF